MSRAGRAWVGLAMTVVCFAVHFMWPPAAGIAVVGVVVAHVGIFSLNQPKTRLAHDLAVGFAAVALYHVTGSYLLPAAVVIGALPAVPRDFIVRKLGYKSAWFLPVAFVAATTLTVAAWPLGLWLLSLAPLLLFLGMGSLMSTGGLRTMEKLARPAWRLKVGDAVPDFTLSDRSGANQFKLSEQRGKHVLVAFLRGDWCPLCHVKMRIYQREAANLAKHDVKLVIVTPDSGATAASFAKDAGLDVMMLADPENKAAAVFDCVQTKAHQGKDAPLPASFLIGPDGKLAYSSRPDDVSSFVDPAAIVRFVEKMSKSNSPEQVAA
jgi:peroxiredoxin